MYQLARRFQYLSAFVGFTVCLLGCKPTHYRPLGDGYALKELGFNIPEGGGPTRIALVRTNDVNERVIWPSLSPGLGEATYMDGGILFATYLGPSERNLMFVDSSGQVSEIDKRILGGPLASLNFAFFERATNGILVNVNDTTMPHLVQDAVLLQIAKSVATTGQVVKVDGYSFRTAIISR